MTAPICQQSSIRTVANAPGSMQEPDNFYCFEKNAVKVFDRANVNKVLTKPGFGNTCTKISCINFIAIYIDLSGSCTKAGRHFSMHNQQVPEISVTYLVIAAEEAASGKTNVAHYSDFWY